MEEPFVFKVNLGGMIDILANHLYSSPDVFVRELLQNGTDAISARRLYDPRWDDGRIDISIEHGKTMTFTDNGTGLTEAEIHRFLAVIGQSSKRDLQTGRIMEDYIGRFGIGMLSCFMVTDEIVVRTRSAKEQGRGHEFHGQPDGTYRIFPLETDIPVGTTIIIHAKKGCEMYFSEEKTTELVRYYGLPLPFPVMMHGEDAVYRINEAFLSAGGGARQQIMDLGSRLFDTHFLDYIPLESKKGLFSGVAYILPNAVSMHSKHSHRIYLKNMLLTEDGSAILPKWSFFLRCFLNTSKLRPTASRESFYEDELLEEARQELNGCISGYLIRLSQENPQLLQQIIHIHFMAIKSMASEDDTFFKTFIPFLKFETNMGQMSGKELLLRHETIGYTTDPNQFHRTSSLMLAQRQLLVNACYVYDTALLHKLQEFDDRCIFYPLRLVSFDNFLETPPSEQLIRAGDLLDAAGACLRQFDCDAELRSFSPSQLPVFYVLDEEAETMREIQHSKENADAIFHSMLDSFAEDIERFRAILYLNSSNPLIQRLMALHNREKQQVCVEILYAQALLTGRFPMQGNEMNLLNDNLIRLIEWGIA